MPSHSDMSATAPVSATPPRVLVADDDPASRRFLCDGLRSLGAHAQACSDGMTALAHARAEAFDLLLLDCRMPGAGALEVFTRLCKDPQAGSSGCIAVATTAELAPPDRQALLAAGFSEILLKPCGLVDLQRMLALTQPEGADAAVLDDQAALSSSGDASTMHALRSLLHEELVLLDRELEPLSRDPVAFGERLHRLRSSCGFCGAAALSTRTIWLQQQLAQHEVQPAALTRFRKTLLATLQALRR
ncbi:response regulator [Rhodanobacter sp. C01]|uniref:response regulator n=1 Tax=Rhodanobacter sp. C01 TaxID=1945856 RepID=UPI000986C698|nr:response regulator [Rhodanobacter sp. C01]OOG49002.1 response regulator [Rhodanobacter sp. C01]